ncbi:MAG: exo-alpha-sialidase [Acidobacteria bacterium]|nr:exo-alpha-sialidase [Acidobacteriota bacterium]
MKLILFSLIALLSPAAEPQRVEGFGKVVFAHNDHPSATVIMGRDFLGRSKGYMTAAWWAPGQVKDNRLEWDTADAPAKKDTIFTFVGASAPLPPQIPRGPEVKLYVNGDYALTFRIGMLRDWEWRGGQFRLRYRAVRNEWQSWGRQRQFELEGNSGVYELVVPESHITAGKPVRIKAEMQPFSLWANGWFMVKDRTDVLQPGETNLRREVDQLRADVTRLTELVHVLATNQTPDPRLTHFTVYTNGYKHLHPADIIPLKGGSMLLTAREATEHVARDGDIVVLRSANGRDWEKVTKFGVPNLDEREACGLELADGTIMLAVFYNNLYREDGEYEQKWMQTVKLGAGKQYLGVYTVTSKDRGKTWSEPNYISTKGMPFSDTEGPADAPIALPDGTLLMPLIGYNVNGDIRNLAAVLLRSTDQGRTWSYYSTMADDPGGKLGQFAEPGLLRLKSGTLLAAMRNTTGNIWMARSKDNGKTWSTPKPSPLVGHPADLIQLADGRVLCSYGIREPYHGTPSGVRASFSRDEGETWDVEKDVPIRTDFLNWDIGYPESRQLPDGRILTVYYYNLLGRYSIGGTLWKP